MQIQEITGGMLPTNCFIVTDEETGISAVIDPGFISDELFDRIKELKKVDAILLTHGHFDHIMGLDGFLQEFHVPVYVHEEDERLMTDPGLNQSGVYTSGYTFDGATYIQEGQEIKAAGFAFKVLHTPGHTPGGVCYYAEAEKILFSGDTLFQSSVGRTDFPLGSMSDLVRGIKEKLMVLPDEVLVYPGHMGETTIGYEKSHNPFL